jgi:hypothetical protein
MKGAVGRAAWEGITIMRVFTVRSVAGAATIVLAVSAVTAGCLTTATSAAVRVSVGAASPDATGYAVAGALDAVAATSAANAWAVGTGTGSKALIVHWNGRGWSSVTTGAPAGTALRAVAASSASNAWALGEDYSGKGTSVILHWNGHAWKRVSFSAPAATYLTSVSVTSPSSAWAVGGYGTTSQHMIALRWNGKSWSRASLPKLPVQAHWGVALNSVSATSRSNAWAVGAFVSDYAGPGTGFTLHWNGKSWKRVASTPATKGDPVAVAATSASNAWLIGCPCQGGPAGAVTGLWTGHAWKTEPTPVAKPPSGGDGAAIAASGHLAWAAGAYCRCDSGNYTNLPMLLRWTGKAWKLTTVPTSKINVLGVAVTSATNAWAVGSSTSQKTVILHWNGRSWH